MPNAPYNDNGLTQMITIGKSICCLWVIYNVGNVCIALTPEQYNVKRNEQFQVLFNDIDFLLIIKYCDLYQYMHFVYLSSSDHT